MRNVEDEYYIVRNVYNEKTVYLDATGQISERLYTDSEVGYGDGPLIFDASFYSYMDKGEEEACYKDGHMDGSFPIVSQRLYEKLSEYETDNFRLLPSIISMTDGTYRDGYYFFNVIEKMDVIDLKLSEVLNPDTILLYRLNKFKLQSEKLDKIPEKERLVIVPKGVMGSPMIVHKKIVDIFRSMNVESVQFFPLTSYSFGDEYS
ncbi:hypothetical protein L4C34_18760 [Vibrio profundum]|uniref:imm11 family protein n=1 Tax=Vibrio profundum TaxID=2910247 RepID=UPI003D0C33A2